MQYFKKSGLTFFPVNFLVEVWGFFFFNGKAKWNKFFLISDFQLLQRVMVAHVHFLCVEQTSQLLKGHWGCWLSLLSPSTFPLLREEKADVKHRRKKKKLRGALVLEPPLGDTALHFSEFPRKPGRCKMYSLSSALCKIV